MSRPVLLSRAAAAWALAFAIAHLYWAVGGDLGFAESAGRSLARDRPLWFLVVGLWGVAAALVLAAVSAVGAVALPRRSTAGRTARLVVVIAAVALLLRAVPTLVQDVLTVSGVLPRPADLTIVHWRLMLWTPWFLLGAALFTGVARTGSYGGRARRGPARLLTTPGNPGDPDTPAS